MHNADVVRVLTEVADMQEVIGGNPYKARAYRRAAAVIDVLPEPLSDVWHRGELTLLPGVGKNLEARLKELLQTGALAEHARLLGQVPRGLLELLNVAGMGPRSVAAAWRALGVTGLDELERACLDGRMARLPRMGPRRVQALLAAIADHRARRGRTPLHRVLPAAEAMLARLRKVPGALRAEACGSLRRRRETVGNVDLLVAAEHPEPVLRAFLEAPDVARVLTRAPGEGAVRLGSGLQVDLRVVPPESFGAALRYFTGSAEHNRALHAWAVKRGLALNAAGLFDGRGRRLAGADEEGLYRALGLAWIPPELREGLGEVEAAERGRLPRLLEEEDVLGDLHVHSEASADASSSLEDLAAEARRLGRRYLAITDHSRALPLGLTAEQLPGQMRAILGASLEAGGSPRLLTGIEVDILADGALDLPERALAGLDCVVASIHSHFTLGREEMTERIIRALRSGVVHVLGHPSGRHLGLREPYDFDLERVLEVARELDVALEVNAMPDRLDLSDAGCRLAKQAGVKLVVNSDAHHASQLANLRYGVWVARRGWLEKEDVLNTRSLEALRPWLRRRPGGAELGAPSPESWL